MNLGPFNDVKAGYHRAVKRRQTNTGDETRELPWKVRHPRGTVIDHHVGSRLVRKLMQNRFACMARCEHLDLRPSESVAQPIRRGGICGCGGKLSAAKTPTRQRIRIPMHDCDTAIAHFVAGEHR